MHCAASISTDGLPLTVAGRIAPVGQEATRVGISHILARSAWLTVGTRVWTPRIAMSEQCTAPHMLRQQAYATRSFDGRLLEPVKYGNSRSITDLTTPDASDAEEWQWTQPW